MTKASFLGKLSSVSLLATLGMATVAATAYSGGVPVAEKRVQIKIVIDGREIDLSDPVLWKHIETAQKAQEAQKKVLVLDLSGHQLTAEKLEIFLRANPATTEAAHPAKALDFLRRMNVVVEKYPAGNPTGLPGQVRFTQKFDADEKVAQAPAGGAAAKPAQDRVLTYVQIAAADPRIEELVKQAEAIKPGSGAEIRKMLQVPKAAQVIGRAASDLIQALEPQNAARVRLEELRAKEKHDIGVEWYVIDKALKLATSKTPVVSSVKITKGADGKQIILLEIVDGKAHAFVVDGVEKEAVDVIRLAPGLTPVRPVDKTADWKVLVDVRKDAKAKEATQKPVATAPSSTVPTSPSTPSAASLESLQRQLERLNAELLDLRKQVGAKTPAK